MAKKATILPQIGKGFDDVLQTISGGEQAQDSGVPKAKFESPDKPIRIGNAETSFYVLENGERVISGRGMQDALTGIKGKSEHVLTKTLHRRNLRDFAEKRWHHSF